MTGLVAAVAAALGNNCTASHKLKKEGCAVSLRDAPKECLIVDFDKPGSPLGPSAARCDYLFVANGGSCAGWIAPLELKKGDLKADKVVPQLQAGATAAENIVSSEEEVKFRPTAAFGSTIRKAERDKLKRENNKVQFHSHVEAVRLIKCGEPLRKALGA